MLINLSSGKMKLYRSYLLSTIYIGTLMYLNIYLLTCLGMFSVEQLTGGKQLGVLLVHNSLRLSLVLMKLVERPQAL